MNNKNFPNISEFIISPHHTALSVKNYEKAIKSYLQALEIYPTMKSPKIMIEQIEALIKEELVHY